MVCPCSVFGTWPNWVERSWAAALLCVVFSTARQCLCSGSRGRTRVQWRHQCTLVNYSGTSLELTWQSFRIERWILCSDNPKDPFHLPHRLQGGGCRTCLGSLLLLLSPSRGDTRTFLLFARDHRTGLLCEAPPWYQHTLSPEGVRGSSDVVPWPDGRERARRMLMNVALRPADARYPPVLRRGDSRGNPSSKRHPAPSDI